MQNNEDTIEPNNNEEIHLGFPMAIRQNSDSKLYNWKIEHYQVYSRYFWSIREIP